MVVLLSAFLSVDQTSPAFAHMVQKLPKPFTSLQDSKYQAISRDELKVPCEEVFANDLRFQVRKLLTLRNHYAYNRASPSESLDMPWYIAWYLECPGEVKGVGNFRTLRIKASDV